MCVFTNFAIIVPYENPAATFVKMNTFEYHALHI